MQEFVNFLLHYYREIILVISIVLEIVILIFKRSKIKYQIDGSILEDIVKWISEAEKLPYKGEDKMKYVLDRVDDRLCINKLGEKSALHYLVREFVENVLNTPTKKGGPGRDEEAKS